MQKDIVGAPFSVSLISGTENDWIREGEYQDFPSKNYSLTVPKHFVEEPFYAVFQNISGSQKVYG